jgi:hypothetical protein
MVRMQANIEVLQLLASTRIHLKLSCLLSSCVAIGGGGGGAGYFGGLQISQQHTRAVRARGMWGRLIQCSFFHH